METRHILLGRPWQFDKHVIHDGLTSKISFHHKGKKITLCPLSAQQVRDDQISLKKKIDEEKREGKKLLKENSLFRMKSQKEKKNSLECCACSKDVVPQKPLKNKNKIKPLLVELALFLLQYKEALSTTSKKLESLPSGVQKFLK